MIRAKFNLRCKDGHHHYSPTPKVWVGRQCGKGLTSETGRNAKKCNAEMREHAA